MVLTVVGLPPPPPIARGALERKIWPTTAAKTITPPTSVDPLILSRKTNQTQKGESAISKVAIAGRHPNVEVTVRYGPSSENLARVGEGKLDLAVLFDWQDMPGGETLRHDPTVWVTSDLHRIHERIPLPIALYASSGWCTDFAIKFLNDRSIPHRIAYTSDTNGGLKLAVMSGLAVAPISRSNIPDGCRELTTGEGFGAIDNSRLVLYRNLRLSSDL